MPLNGIDIASWEGDKNIDPVAVAGDFVIVKATQGRGYQNPYYRRHMDALRPSRKFRGAYHWCDPDNKPAEDVANFMSMIGPELEAGSVPLFVDWEEPGQWHLTGWLAEFMELLEAKAGQKPVLYTYDNVLRNADFSALEGRHPLWYARYPSTAATGYKDMPKPSFGKWDIVMWQYAASGVIPGFTGKPLDLDIFYGDASDWRRLADRGATPESSAPKEHPVTIPAIRENDPAVHLVNSHGETLRSSSGAPRMACVCMAMTFPLIEQEMIRRGLIKRTIDVYQGGYNAGKVAASAGTHDMGGVIDVAQGITLDQRKVWAEFGVMMFPRTRQYGWNTGDHGHGVWHGCVHRTASAAKQVRDGIAGRDGLVSNTVRNFEAPRRTWQDAYRAAAATVSKSSTPQPPAKDDDMPAETPQSRTTFQHPGGDWMRVRDDKTGEFVDTCPAGEFSAFAQIHGPEPMLVRYCAFVGEDFVGSFGGPDGWWRGLETSIDAKDRVSQGGYVPGTVQLDIWMEHPGEITVEQQALWWPR